MSSAAQDTAYEAQNTFLWMSLQDPRQYIFVQTNWLAFILIARKALTDSFSGVYYEKV